MKTVLLVGLGRMGYQGFPSAPLLSSHYQAIINHRGLSLVGGVDTDERRRLSFQQETATLVYSSIDTAPYADLVIIATPASSHRACVEAAVTHGAKGIICEKPIATTLDDAKAILAICSHTPLIIGHQRRYEQRHILLRHFIESHALGVPQAASCWFSGDILENGTHAADTLHFLVGNHTPSTITQVKGERFRVMVSCERGSVALESRKDLEPGYLHAMYNNLIGCINCGEQPACSGEDGLEALRHALNYREMIENAA